MPATIHVRIRPGQSDQKYLRVDDVVLGRFSPESVFKACNRIDGQRTDMARLTQSWQKVLRRQLDEVEAPSFSVGDHVTITTSTGFLLGHWECAPVGWIEQRLTTPRPTIVMEDS